MHAATARFEEDGDTRIGYGWFTTRHGDHEVVWHNGATSGFRSYVGFERATGRAVVVLGNTDQGVEPIGLRLLGVPEKEAGTAAPVAPVWIGAGLALAFTFMGGLSLLGTARRRELDRVTVLAAAVWAFAYLGLAHRMGTGRWCRPGSGHSAPACRLREWRWRRSGGGPCRCSTRGCRGVGCCRWRVPWSPPCWRSRPSPPESGPHF
ncbi:serine hydrolase [Micromonospora sp. M12]